MAKRTLKAFRLSDQDIDLIAGIQVDMMNHLPPGVKGSKRILSATDVVRAAIRRLAMLTWCNQDEVEVAYYSLKYERAYDDKHRPSQPFEVDDE